MKVAMLFPGYSSQFVGMGKELYDEYRVVQEFFEEASNCLNLNFVKLCFASSDAELSKVHNAYPAMFLVSTSIAALLAREGLRPALVAGYCDGDFAALSAAGCINLPDGLYLLTKYGLLYEEAIKGKRFGALRVMGISKEILILACERVSIDQEMVFIGLSHGENDYVVTGHKDAIERLLDEIAAHDCVKFEQIGLGVGLHSPLTIGLAKQLKMYLEKIDFKMLAMPFLSSTDGVTFTSGADAKLFVTYHPNKPLDYSVLLNRLGDYDMIIEVGYKMFLHNLIKNRYPSKSVVKISNCADIKNLRNILRTI
jgi:[acyl-carrier-protein] S-malonyltransferase